MVTALLHETQQFGAFDFGSSNLDLGDLRLIPPATIRGRAVASDTGSPLSGANVILRRCDSSGCSEFVNSQTTDSNGQFLFNSFSSGAPLSGGTYELEISTLLYQTRHIAVTVGNGENRDLGDISTAVHPKDVALLARYDHVKAKGAKMVEGNPVVVRCDASREQGKQRGSSFMHLVDRSALCDENVARGEPGSCGLRWSYSDVFFAAGTKPRKRREHRGVPLAVNPVDHIVAVWGHEQKISRSGDARGKWDSRGEVTWIGCV